MRTRFSAIPILAAALALVLPFIGARAADPPLGARIARYDAGSALLDAGLNEKAAQSFERALDENGGLAELGEGLIEARSRLCAPNAALAYCAKALDRTTGPQQGIFKLFLSGEKARLQRDFSEAAVYFRRARDAAALEKDTLSAILCGEALAMCLLSKEDAPGALESVRALPALSPNTPSAGRLRAGIMLHEADCLNASDRIGEADSLYRDALSLAKASGFRWIERGSLAGLGRLGEKRQRNEDARDFYARALALARDMMDKEGIAILLNNLGQVEVNVGALDAAEGHFAQAWETADACGLNWILGYVLYGRGALAESRGNKEEAIGFFQQALAAQEEKGSVQGELGAHLRLGYLRSSLGEYARAIRHYTYALEAYEKTNNLYGLGWTLGGLAVTYHKLGDFKKAGEYYRRALDVKRRLGDERGAAWSLNSLGMIEDLQGRYRNALSFEDEAMTIYEKVGDRAGVGEALYGLGDYDQALKHYGKAFAIAVETGNRSLLGKVASGMGSAYQSAGRPDLAGDFYVKCLELARASKEPTEIGWALNNLASFRIELGEIATARKYLEEALRLLPGEGQDYLRARTLYLVGSVGKEDSSSIACFERALSLAEESGLEELKWKCLSDLGELYFTMGDTAKSYALQHRAIVSVESLRRLAGADELRRRFLEPAILPYERIVSVILSRSGNASDVKEAFSYTEQCRAQILASLLREAMERTGSKVNDRLLDAERATLSRLTYCQARLQNGTITPQERAELLAKIDDIEQRFINLRLMLERGNGEYVAALYPIVEQPDELLSTLAADERVLSFFLGARRSYVFCGRGEELTVRELPAKDFIERRVDYFLGLLQQMADAPEAAPPDSAALTEGARVDSAAPAPAAIPDGVLDSAANELFELLLGPVAEKLGSGERLIIIPDGLLSRLPFALLKSGGRYLVEDHDVSYAPSLRTLLYLRQRNVVRARSTRVNEYNVIAIGASGESAAGSKGGSRVYPFTDIPIEPLQRAAQEAKDVSSIFSRSLVLSGRSAEESAFKGSRLDNTGIIHVAAHAYIDDSDLRRSFIVLNPERSFEDTLALPAEDGLLQWQEIAALKLNAALVTLSACRSAGGVLSSGEGISGLTEAFLYAGAGCVVAAQLDVSDELAGGMMVEYYRNVRKGLGCAAALSAAQRWALARSDVLGRPAVWGAFAAIGDGASAPKLSRGFEHPMRIVLALCATAAALVALFVLRRRR
jgi:CHAT domain-containing protein/tetratricopeptide (TPR) repeat protein